MCQKRDKFILFEKSLGLAKDIFITVSLSIRFLHFFLIFVTWTIIYHVSNQQFNHIFGCSALDEIHPLLLRRKSCQVFELLF